MTNAIASIFKILIKVPIAICVSYFIINLFAFSFCYFRVLGVSYSLQQIVMENNYLPEKEALSFDVYLDNLETGFLKNLHAVVYTGEEATGLDTCTGREADGAFIQSPVSYGVVLGNNERRQYGDTAYVGVVSDFKALWPLRMDEFFVGNEGVIGFNGTETHMKSDSQMEDSRKYSTAMLDVIHPVIGLQYYSDLE